jgi:hypothetical protein
VLVRQVGLVAAQVRVHPGGSGDRSGHPVRRDQFRRQHPDAHRAGAEDLVAEDKVLDVGQPAAYRLDRHRGTAQPARGQVLLETADPVEHVVHPAAGQLLHHGLDGLALAECVEDRRDRTELERVRAEEHQVVEDPVELGHQGADPDRPLGHLQAHHPFDREHHAELVGESRQPVVPVRQHDDLAVVADLEQLLRAAVHVPDDRLAGDDPLAVQGDPQPQHAVRRRVLRADVQHHVGRREVGAAAPLVPEARGARADPYDLLAGHPPRLSAIACCQDTRNAG